jgi:hypothetical protein
MTKPAEIVYGVNCLGPFPPCSLLRRSFGISRSPKSPEDDGLFTLHLQPELTDLDIAIKEGFMYVTFLAFLPKLTPSSILPPDAQTYHNGKEADCLVVYSAN